MNASYPIAVTAAAGRPHHAGYNTPESVVVAAEYPEDFIGVFSINYAAMHYQPRNDQMNQLDGDQARMEIGREECKVYKQGRRCRISGFRTNQYSVLVGMRDRKSKADQATRIEDKVKTSKGLPLFVKRLGSASQKG